MNRVGRTSGNKQSWLERLGQILMGEPRNREALVTLLRDAQHRKLLDKQAVQMMEGVMLVSDTQVRDVMIPRDKMVVLEQGWNLEQLITVIIDSGHSRFPVIRDSKDNVVGILTVKDLLMHAFSRRENFYLQALLRPVKFIPENKKLHLLLNEFLSKHLHMAIVVDEYGDVAGLITIGDILKEIVGEIDEHIPDDQEPIFIRRHGNYYIVKALTPVEDFNKYFQSSITARADTIGGLLIMKVGYLPKISEVVYIDKFCFRVLHTDNWRIHTLELTLQNNDQCDSNNP